MKYHHPRFLHLFMGWAPWDFTRAPRLLSASAIMMILASLSLSTGCCSHVDHKKLATFPTIRKSFEGLKDNLQAIKVQDSKDEELKALSIEECNEGINLCRKAEAQK